MSHRRILTDQQFQKLLIEYDAMLDRITSESKIPRLAQGTELPALPAPPRKR